jgi:hypothetical protein
MLPLYINKFLLGSLLLSLAPPLLMTTITSTGAIEEEAMIRGRSDLSTSLPEVLGTNSVPGVLMKGTKFPPNIRRI